MAEKRAERSDDPTGGDATVEVHHHDNRTVECTIEPEEHTETVASSTVQAGPLGHTPREVGAADQAVLSPSGLPAAEETIASSSDLVAGSPDDADAGGGAVDEDAVDEESDDVQFIEERVVVMRRGPFIALTAIGTLLVLALAAFGLYQWKKPAAGVATVNGATISRTEYDKAVAAANGQQVLDDLINQRLVETDASRKKVSVSTDDVDAKLKEIKKQFPADADYRQALDTQHVTELELRDRIRRSLLLQKLAGNNIQVSDQEVQQAYDQGKDTQYQGKSLDDVKTAIHDQLMQQKQQDASSSYLDGLKKSAKIVQHLPGKPRS